jgi:nitronate monooxygenase
VNLFVPEDVQPTEEQLQQAEEALRPIRDELEIFSTTSQFAKHEFEGQIQVLIEEGVKVCSFTFGLPDEKIVQLLKENKVFLIGTATTVEEAVLAEQAGMDAVVAQGGEAGGHRGSFTKPLKVIPLNELLKDVVASVKIPVIAAGGIANREMVELALSTGAQAVQIGTAFLAAHESGANPLHKEAILSAQEGSTVLTTAYSGKAARGIRNRFIEEMENAAIAPYPYQNELTKEIRKQALGQGKIEFLSLWAGENVHLSKGGKLKEIIEQLI